MRTSPLLLGVLATALPYTQAAANPFELASNAGKAVVRGVLSNVLGFNETKVDKIMNTDVPMIPAHPYALDLNDTNWETAIRTGTYNPLAAPLDKDTVWIIHVYGPDA